LFHGKFFSNFEVIEASFFSKFHAFGISILTNEVEFRIVVVQSIFPENSSQELVDPKLLLSTGQPLDFRTFKFMLFMLQRTRELLGII